ncbi:MAG: hypothetical protein KAH32_03870, partial [Chlamydiia bacterium]|nr:hypothetical protein [Chlamydiia bacterium]
MAQFDNLPKTIYNNLDGSDKTTQTLPTKVGAWDMEQLVTKINELTTFIRDMASSNDTGIVSFDNIYGTWVNSPSAPVTTAIQYTLADAKNGAVAGVYYQATDLVITDPDSRIVMLTTDAFESDVLCIVWFAFDEGTGGINVNVQTGDTGNRPLPVGNIRPIITLLGQALAQVTVGTSYTDAGATASDSEDGDITS